MNFSQIYLQNRQDFYSTLIPRIPDPELARRLREAVVDIKEIPELAEMTQELPKPPRIRGLPEDLKLDDLLKKTGHGVRSGRTTISFREALNRAEHIERVGIVMFHIIEKYGLMQPGLSASCKTSGELTLLNILRLRDQLEYHRLKLGSPG